MTEPSFLYAVQDAAGSVVSRTTISLSVPRETWVAAGEPLEQLRIEEGSYSCLRCTQLVLRAVPVNWSVKVAGPQADVPTARLATVPRPDPFGATAR